MRGAIARRSCMQKNALHADEDRSAIGGHVIFMDCHSIGEKPALSHCSSNISGQPISFRRFCFFFLLYFLGIPGDAGDDMGFSCSPRLSSFSGSSGFQ